MMMMTTQAVNKRSLTLPRTIADRRLTDRVVRFRLRLGRAISWVESCTFGTSQHGNPAAVPVDKYAAVSLPYNRPPDSHPSQFGAAYQQVHELRQLFYPCHCLAASVAPGGGRC